MKKQAAMIAICAALLLCVAAAGCTSSSSSSPTPSATANSSPQAATASATVTPTATVTPAATATPSPSASSGGTAGLTVLFFYEPGCPYCAAFESTSSFQQLQNKVPVQWIVSATSPLTDQYGVATDPTLILLKNGAEVGRWVDPADATGILAQINAG